MRNAITVLLLLLLTATTLTAQDTRIIKGKIHVAGQASQGIIAKVYETDQPLNMTISSETGEFSVNVSNTKISLTIEPLNTVDFTQKQVTVAKNKSFIKIGLEQLTFEAEEEKLGRSDGDDAMASPRKERTKASKKATFRGGFTKTGSVERAVVGGKIATKKKAYIAMDKGTKGIITYADAETVPPLAKSPKPKAGLLTAGELDDFSKWKMWQDITKVELKAYQETWEMSPLNRYSVQLTTAAGFPIVDAQLKLKDKFGKVLWETRTDNTGKGELWNELFLGEENKVDVIEASIGDQVHQFEQPKTFHKGVNTHQFQLACNMPNAVDIAFVVDATASMGDEIDYLKLELASIIKKVKDSIPWSNINLGSVFYRDYYDSYLTVKSDFSTNIASTIDFIKEQSAKGGGDFPEAVDEGLKVAINELSWSESAKARLLFLVLDAPPHENSEVRKRLKELTQTAAKKGIRIIPVTASGIDKSAEYLMRSLALATNGTYTFLTDDSGIGNAHIKPTTDEYKVELLNDLLVRLILEYTHSSDCEQFPVDYMVTAMDTVIQADTLLAQVDSTIIDSTLIKVDPVDPVPVFTWKYYPNPTSGKITVELSEKVEELFITDISGKIIMRVEPKKGFPNLIDLSPYPTGIYFIRFMVGEEQKFGRVLLTRGNGPRR